jgi:hypothetical protein
MTKEQAELVLRVIRSFDVRQQSNGYKGKKRDELAVEFAVGALATESHVWGALGYLAFVTAMRGYKGMIDLGVSLAAQEGVTFDE